MKRVLRVTTESCADTQKEIDDLIAEATAKGGELTKKIVEIKQKKSKGEVVAEHFKVTLQVTYDEIWSDFVKGED